MYLHQRFTYRLCQQRCINVHFPGNNLLHLGILAVRSRNQLRLQLACRCNHQLSDSLQLGACLRQQNVLTLFVLHHALISFMRMTVNDAVYAGRVLGDIFTAPLRRRAVHAQMPNYKDIICALLAGSVDIFLQLLIKLLAARILAEAVNIFSLSILEKSRRRGGQSLRRRCTDEGHLLILKLHQLIAGQHLLFRAQIHKVRAVIASLLLRHQLQEACHAIIKFMVAGNAEVIAYCVHNVHYGLACRQLAQRSALNRIACIHQRHVRRLCQRILFQLRQTGKANVIVHAAVNVIRMQNHNIMLQRPSQQRSGKRHRCRN